METFMDFDLRAITKIAREAKRFVTNELHRTGLDSEDYEFIHFVRHHSGCSQNDVADILNVDKSTISRKTRRLAEKGFIKREEDPNDRRTSRLFATEKAQEAKRASIGAEERFYQYILRQSGLSSKETTLFLALLEKLYHASKEERKADFSHIKTNG